MRLNNSKYIMEKIDIVFGDPIPFTKMAMMINELIDEVEALKRQLSDVARSANAASALWRRY